MLYLTRKVGESVIINDEIEVTVVDIRGKSIKLGFTFPADASVLRREIHERIQAENRAAAAGTEALAVSLGNAGQDPGQTSADGARQADGGAKGGNGKDEGQSPLNGDEPDDTMTPPHQRTQVRQAAAKKR